MPAQYRDAFQLREFAYPSNLLTLARLLLLPAALRYARQPDRRMRALALFGVAMGTDAIDGPIARMRGEVSALGKVLDPIADKLLIDSTAIVLSQAHGFPWWITRSLLLRDAAILLGSLVVYRTHAQINVAHPTGKLATLALAAAMLLYLADGPRSGKPALYVALLPFGASMAVYAKALARTLR